MTQIIKKGKVNRLESTSSRQQVTALVSRNFSRMRQLSGSAPLSSKKPKDEE
jgi:hypothetical protein